MRYLTLSCALVVGLFTYSAQLSAQSHGFFPKGEFPNRLPLHSARSAMHPLYLMQRLTMSL